MVSQRTGRVLSVFAGRQFPVRIDSLLDSLGLNRIERSRASGGHAALALAEVHRFDLIVAQHPLSDVPAPELLTRIRRSERGRETPFLFLTPERFADELGGLESEGVSVLTLDRAEADLGPAMIKGLMPVARRREHLVVETQEVGAGRAIPSLCQSRDLSQSGAFLITRRTPSLGARLRLKLFAGSDVSPIEVEAEVVRYANPRLESEPGIGLRFSEFLSDGRERLGRLLSTGQVAAA